MVNVYQRYQTQLAAYAYARLAALLEVRMQPDADPARVGSSAGHYLHRAMQVDDGTEQYAFLCDEVAYDRRQRLALDEYKAEAAPS